MNTTLLNTYCTLQSDNSYIKTDTYYSSSRQRAGNSPLTTEDNPAFTCTPFQIARDVKVDEFCATGASSQPVLRKVYTNGGTNQVQFLREEDSTSTACNNQCHLIISHQQAVATSSPGTRDGKLYVTAYSTTPPLSCYVPTLGNPTSTLLIPNTTPQFYQFTYENVAPGSYVAEVQDGANCRLDTDVLIVTAGSLAIDPAITWFKYKYKDNNQNTPQITGYAWNKTTKTGYPIDINLNIPQWYEYTPEYKQGDRVIWLYSSKWRIFQAAKNIVADTNGSRKGKVPMPTLDSVNDGTWSFVNDGLHAGTPGAEYTIASFMTNINQSNAYVSYQANDIVLYGYNHYYKAKSAMLGYNYIGTTLPKPSAGVSNNFWEYLPNYTEFSYLLPESDIVDSYAVGNATRTVSYYAKNPDNLTYVPTATIVTAAADAGDYVLLNDTIPDLENASGDLKILDIIKNDIDDTTAENGSFAIIAQSPSMPISFHLVNGVRTGYVQDNQTGVYENLYAGDYEVYVKDADDRQVIVTVPIRNPYKLRWRLKIRDIKNIEIETRIFERDYTGDVTDIIGTDDPVVLSWDAGSNANGLLPESVGSVLELNLLTQFEQQFVDTSLFDDRKHRVDFYRSNTLRFRGYIDSTSYQEALLGSGQKVTLRANDGLGKLRSTVFKDFYGDRQTARTNMMSIVLKILSFNDVNLPVYCGLNLRDKLMTADGDPLLEAFVHRSAYDKKDGKVIPLENFIDCRTVLDNILRLFHAMLFQADGKWWIISINEVYDLTTVVRAYSPAGVRLTSADTSAAPLRILPSLDATGARELFWVKGGQLRTTVPAARYIKSVVDLKLETSLFANGDFILWNDTRPTYWTKTGTPTITKTNGEKAGEKAVKFSNYTINTVTGNYLLSPAAPHLPGAQEDFMKLTLRARVLPTTSDPAASLVTMYVQVVCNGNAYLNPYPVPMSSADGWKDYTIDLPMGMPGTAVRVRLIQPVLAAGSPGSSLLLNSAHLSIQPGQFNWSNTTSDFSVVLNPDGAAGIKIGDVEIANADLPLLPNANTGIALPARGMDVYAWLHAISLADFSATTSWKRPAYPGYTPMLQSVAQDRIALRTAPVSIVEGEVAGNGIAYLRQGLMLDLPLQVDGKFIITSCFINQKKGTAKITARLLAAGDYDSGVLDLPDGVRIAAVAGRIKYRISYNNGVEAYRIAKK